MKKNVLRGEELQNTINGKYYFHSLYSYIYEYEYRIAQKEMWRFLIMYFFVIVFQFIFFAKRLDTESLYE